ncbi:MAG: fumarylacetoacetate hydrolase family protein, partial [Phenylobacterium sp.]|nr:fumarylacetoacetate hydrolase family protein [Phenylobacterium sp.]
MTLARDLVLADAYVLWRMTAPDEWTAARSIGVADGVVGLGMPGTAGGTPGTPPGTPLVVDDVSVRDWQFRAPTLTLGKSFDTHAPIGPWITTSDEIDPHNLALKCLVNGEERQSSNTRHLVFDVFDQVAHLSQAMTLEPGDLVFTGTPGGIGAAMTPRRFLKPGDVVRCEIEGLGHIENRFEPEA